MIHEVLAEGSANARTGKELAKLFGCDIRTITDQIERERRQGQPICANLQGNVGYYLAETPEELEAQFKQMRKRGGELFKTSWALEKTHQRMVEERKNQEAAEDGRKEKQ